MAGERCGSIVQRSVGLLALTPTVDNMMSVLVPDTYAATLKDLKKHVHAARLEVQRKVKGLLHG
ncbi:hypothetical protein RN51_01581 [Microbacterium oxydans]|uniref:Uncharacterized protein n=1 Tax=Microbacterium oxydans TaxID=82380 RepID=A0A0F0KTP7_9MICO|nr:hypothetical protein RN51_01581 [Microbacterium oxydans]